MPSSPPIKLTSEVDASDRISAIDFVNRVNWLFEVWNVDAIIDAFLPDSTTYHFHGTIRGHGEIRHFLEEVYPYIIPGVTRLATNHIVDPDGDGVVVHYHNILVRYASAEEAPVVVGGKLLESHEDLPGIWLYSRVADRLRRGSAGWKVFERYIGASTINQRLQPSRTDPAYFKPFLPKEITA